MEYDQSAWKCLAFFHFGFVVLVSSFSSIIACISLVTKKSEEEEKEKRI